MLAPSACHQLWAESWQTYSSRRPWLKLLSPHAHAHRPCQLNAVVPRLLLSEADTLLEAGYAGVAEACCLVRTPHQGCHESVGLSSWPGQGVDVTSMAQTDGNICVPLRHCFPCHQLQTLLWIYCYSSIQQLLHRVLEPAASPCPSPTGKGISAGDRDLPPPAPLLLSAAVCTGEGNTRKSSSGSSAYQLLY